MGITFSMMGINDGYSTDGIDGYHICSMIFYGYLLDWNHY